MGDPYSIGTLAPLLFSIVVFLVAKLFAKLGLLHAGNAGRATKLAAVAVGVVYAVLIDIAPRHSLALEWAIRAIGGAFVATVLYIFLVMAIGGAVADRE